MNEKLPLKKIARSFENNILAINVLNDKIGCTADDHDKKIKEEFKKNTEAAIDSFVKEIKAKHQDDKPEEGENKEKKDISEKEAKEIADSLRKAIFSTDEFRKAHKKLKKSAPKQGPILRRGALISLLSCFETLVAQLVREFYRQYPEAFPAESKSLTLANLKEIGSIEDAESYLIDTEIDSILRGNVISQIGYFVKPIKIDIRPIEKFIDNLVEISQRRNILVHNDGIINKHYLSKTPPSLISKEAEEGNVINVDQDYISEASNTVYVIGLIMIQQCFRKWHKDKVETADTFFN